jgi:RHS repeat-associated protein
MQIKSSKQALQFFIAPIAIALGLISNTAIAQTPHVPVNYPAGAPVNYVRTWDAMAPIQDANALMARPLQDVKQATQYIDGLGRPVQTVLKQGSMVTGQAATDMVSPVEYDAFGREQYKWLPYQSPSANGLFKQNPFTEQVSFYNTQLSGQVGETNIGTGALNWGYSKTNFEPSPLNRVTDTYAPGSSWAGSEANADPNTRRNVQIKYAINTAKDTVRIWTVTDNPVLGVLGTYTSNPNAATNYTAVYNAGQLYKTITTDEHKKQVIEFKDKEGKVLLKKVQLTATADDGTGSGYSGWLSTYYIYDDFGNLRGVIQPEGVKALSTTNWQLTAALLAEQCFRYEYDQRNRMIKKKVPGAGEVWMVYDNRDRLVLTQDANMRSSTQQKWLYTQYDELNRPVATGFITDAANYNNLSYHITAAYNSTAYPDLIKYTSEELTRAFYNDYSWLGTYGNPLPATYNSAYNTYFQPASNTAWPYPQANVQSTQIKGMATGSRVKVLGTTTYLYTVNFYDDKGRVIQTQSTNNTGGTDIATTQYTWAGQPLVTVQRQQKAGSTNPQEHIVITKMQYDDLGRVLNVKKTINSTVNNIAVTKPEQLIVQNEYNALGQLKKKTLGNNNLENLNYDYNIRGWLLGTNRAYAKDITPSPAANTGNGYFGFDLGYDKTNNGLINNQTYTAAQYNGNIEGMVWKSKGDTEKRKYDFGYDAANRLLKADFTQYTSNAFNQTAGVNYNVKMGDGITLLPDGSIDPTKAYDANGNILQMQQWGLKINTSAQIDNLKYTYIAGTNRLKSVTDFSNDALTKLGDFKTNTTHPQSGLKSVLTPASSQAQFDAITDYSYDVNGNLNLDNNKAISSITYNHLNLPQVITVAGKGLITYTYDAAGNKLQKQVSESGGPGVNRTVTTTYLNGFVYETKVTNAGGAYDPTQNYTDVLQFIPQEEGRIRFKPAIGTIAAGFQYDYMLKDHLGNVRMVLTEEQQQDKYPIASLEDAKLSTEQGYYDINTNYIKKTDINPVPGLPTYSNNYNGIGNNPADATFEQANSKNLYRINGNENKTGLGITLKVMAGDKVNILGNSYYSSAVANNAPCPGCALSALNLITNFLNAPNAAATAAAHGAVSPSTVEAQAGANITGILQNAQNNQTATYNNRPRAFINYIIFDEQFKYAGGGTSIVGAAGAFTKHQNDPQLQDITVPKNGYIYVYCSNESNTDVFFDNLQVVHSRGAILEETHYYPFGLTMAGISSKAAGSLENNKKYNGIEETRELDLNEYDAFFRTLDPQTGRWWQIDPKPNYDETLYGSMGNNPILHTDILGDTPTTKSIAKGVADGFTGTFSNTGHAITHPVETVTAVADNMAEHPVEYALNLFSYDNYGRVKQLYNDTKENGFGYALGRMLGMNTAEATIAVGTAGVVKGLGGGIRKLGIKNLSRTSTKSVVKTGSSVPTNYYPPNMGFLGTPETKFLMPGEEITRFGSGTGKFFSPQGTPIPMRALPPDANTNISNTFKVLKPFEVQAGQVAPAFGQPGLGIQYLSPVSADVLLKHGIIGY